MKLEQSFQLALSPAKVWPAFHDLSLLVPCLPGAMLTGPVVANEVPMRFDVKLGPIAAGFVGTGKLALDEAAKSGSFEGAATDKRSNTRVKGSAQFVLEASPTGTLVKVTVDYSLTGTLAQFGRAGIVKELANALTLQFANNLSERLQSAQTESAPAPAEVTETPTPAPAPAQIDARPLDGTALLFSALKTRFQMFFKWVFGRSSH